MTPGAAHRLDHAGPAARLVLPERLELAEALERAERTTASAACPDFGHARPAGGHSPVRRTPPRANRPEPRARALARAVLAPRAVVEPGTTCQRRRPEDTVLHQVVRDHLEAFLADARARSPHGLGAPRHVERELRGYVRCGLLAHGFIRTRCAACGFERLVAFACKGRAVCPSRRGRRMADLAAHLVDRVLPVAP